MIVEHCGKQIVCRTDSVEITGEMEIDIFHRNNLGISSACRTALDSENGSERRLTQSNNGVLAESSQTVGKTDGRCGFALACRGWCNCGYKNEFAVLFVGFIE